MKRKMILLVVLAMVFSYHCRAQDKTQIEAQLSEQIREAEARVMDPCTTSLLKNNSILWAQTIDSALYYERVASQWQYLERQVFKYNTSFSTTNWELSKWDDILAKWQSDRKIDFVYDGSGNPKTETSYRWDQTSSSWIPREMQEFLYYSMFIRKETVESSWNATANQWDLVRRISYNYDSLLQRSTVSTYQRWDDVKKKWVNDRRISSFHDSMKRLDSSVTANWDTISMAWLPDSYSKYTWNSNNRITELLSFIWNSSSNSWDSNSKNEYVFNSNGDQIFYRFSLWDTGLKQFYAYISVTRTYDVSDNVILEVDSVYDFGTKTLLPDSRSSYSYDIDNSLQSETNETWDDLSSTWVQVDKVDHKSDNRHHRWNVESTPFTGKSLFWGRWLYISSLPLSATTYSHDGSTWQLEGKAEYYYTSINTEINHPDFGNSLVYPNPAIDQINFIFRDRIPSLVRIIDLQGKTVYEKSPNQYSLKVNLNLPSGFYIAEIAFENQKEIIKLIINK